jgi:hypothetical protein
LEPGCSANITTKKATVHKPDADLVGSTKGKTLVVSRSTPGTCDISVVYKINRIDFPRGQFNVLSSRIDINETNLVVLTSGNHYSCQIAQCIVPHWNGSYRTHFVYVDEYTVNSPKNNNGQMEKNGTEYKFDREPKWWNRSFSDDTSNGKRLHGSAFTEINGHTFEISLFYE